MEEKYLHFISLGETAAGDGLTEAGSNDGQSGFSPQDRKRHEDVWGPFETLVFKTAIATFKQL